MNFTESIVKFTTNFEASNYDTSSLTKVMDSLDEGHHFLKRYQEHIVDYQVFKKNPMFNSFIRENKWGWLKGHNFPLTLEILNKDAVPGKKVSVKIMGFQRRTLVIYYAICPELENFVNIVNWVDSESSMNSWKKIRDLIKNQGCEVLEFSKSCGIRLPNKIHPGFDRNPKLVKKEILQSLYDWRRSFFLFDDGYAISSHNSPINFRKIFFGIDKETTFVDIRTTIGKFLEPTLDGFKILIPTLFGKFQSHDFVMSDANFPKSKISSNKLYIFQIFHKSGEKNIEDHIIKIEEINPKELLGMFHAVSCYLLYLGDMRLRILNKKSFQKLYSHLFTQVSNFLMENNLPHENLKETDWIKIQEDFTSPMTRWIEDLFYVPPLMRKTFDDHPNPLLREFLLKEFDSALAEKRPTCFEKTPFNEQGNKWFNREIMGKLNRVYSLVNFILNQKRFINGFGRFKMNNREREYNILKQFLVT